MARGGTFFGADMARNCYRWRGLRLLILLSEDEKGTLGVKSEIFTAKDLCNNCQNIAENCQSDSKKCQKKWHLAVNAAKLLFVLYVLKRNDDNAFSMQQRKRSGQIPPKWENDGRRVIIFAV